MGMPQIPAGTYRPTWNETVVDLLESIALEEMAIAHIMNAEGEKAQEVVRRYAEREIGHRELHRSCRDAQSMMNSLIMKEWLLFTKLNTVLDMDVRGDASQGRPETQAEPCPCSPPKGSTMIKPKG